MSRNQFLFWIRFLQKARFNWPLVVKNRFMTSHVVNTPSQSSATGEGLLTWQRPRLNAVETSSLWKPTAPTSLRRLCDGVQSIVR